jgi:hypothetical protein
LIFTNLEGMIHYLIIGNNYDVGKYSLILSKSQFFDRVVTVLVNEKGEFQSDIHDYTNFDAIFLVSQLEKPYQLFFDLIRDRCNFYFSNQPNLSIIELTKLDQLYIESGNLIFPEFKEINHPLVQEFISIQSNQLLFRYNKSISGKREISSSLFNGLSFLTLLSPMPVKKINVNSLETTNSGRPVIKVRLKMWDSSICYIVLKIDNKNEHSILLESKNGNFIFNLAENYLENIHGTRFKSEEVTDDELLQKTVDSFAMDIILNKKPIFSFNHYLLAVNILSKIENILSNSF